MTRKPILQSLWICGAMICFCLSGFAQAPTSCNVTYTVSNQWNVGFQVGITISNTGTTPISSWQLQWAFANGQTISQLWNGNVSQSGVNVTVNSLSYNGTIAPGGSYKDMGFVGNWSGANVVPASFSINGTHCGPPGGSGPSIPTNLTATAITTTSATLNWTASTDSSATITGYDILNGATVIGSSTTTSFVASGLTPATAFTLSVRAKDSAGMVSAASTGVTFTTLSTLDTTPPTTPTALGVTGTTGSTISLKWTASTDNVGVAGYKITNVTTGTVAGTTTTPTFTATGLTASTTYTFTVTANDAAGNVSPAASVTSSTGAVNVYTQHFIDLWNDIHNPAKGYFSPEGVPYHSVETLIVEAPDYGHETTSETYSYWIWLEAEWGNVTGNWSNLQTAWNSIEAHMIPTTLDQPTNSFYSASKPATFAPELDDPNQYPSPLNTSVTAGSDPLAAELNSTYGTPAMYGMHWIIDSDNFYGYGLRGDGTTHPSYINTFQRGPQESVWETVPQPSFETFRWGGPSGYLPLFILDTSYAKQWRYTDAPDADARAIQAMYWAKVFADAQGGNATVNSLVGKATKLGDYLRYSMFDKYFKTMGCTSLSCPAGSGYNSAHYLLSWYYAWGGATDASAGWAWRIGSSASHFGYQNPMAAWALSNFAPMKPASPNGARDWGTSLQRQLEFYRWLQSAEGGIAGGATNSWQGRYLAPPAGDSTFYGMAFDFEPVFHDPPSNQWFGFQAWSMERVAEYYFVTGDAKAKLILDPWITWVINNTALNADGTYAIPSTLNWTGQPSMNWDATHQNFTAGDPTFNSALHVTIVDTTQDVGVTAAVVKALSFYSAGTKKFGTQHVASQTLAKALLDRMWTLYRDAIGVSSPEMRKDYNRFNDPVFIPPAFTGVMPNGDAINGSSTFLSIRSKYKSDPAFAKVQTYLNTGTVPTFNYHRFWAEVDIALANAEYARLFP